MSHQKHSLLLEMFNRGAIKSFAEGRRYVECGAVNVNGIKATAENLHDDYSYELSAIRIGKRDFPSKGNFAPTPIPYWNRDHVFTPWQRNPKICGLCNKAHGPESNSDGLTAEGSGI